MTTSLVLGSGEAGARRLLTVFWSNAVRELDCLYKPILQVRNLRLRGSHQPPANNFRGPRTPSCEGNMPSRTSSLLCFLLTFLFGAIWSPHLPWCTYRFISAVAGALGHCCEAGLNQAFCSEEKQLLRAQGPILGAPCLLSQPQGFTSSISLRLYLSPAH